MAGRREHATRVVLDASVWLRLFVAGPDSADAATLIEGEDQHAAPDLLFVEFANVLRLKRREGALSAAQVEQAIEACFSSSASSISSGQES
jgi:predicted nucleic acid-binding protein